MEINRADVAELVDARDLKSLDGNVVWVRVPPPAPAFALRATARHASPSVEREGCRAVARRAKGGLVSRTMARQAGARRGDACPTQLRRESEDGLGDTRSYLAADRPFRDA